MIVLGYIVGFIAMVCFWGAIALTFSKYDTKEESARLALVGIICAFITYWLLYDTLVSSLCEQTEKRGYGICKQKSKDKEDIEFTEIEAEN